VTGACYLREFLQFLRRVSAVYPRRDLHIVCDNYGTRKRLARSEETLARLEITRETVTGILSDADAGQQAAGQAVDAPDPVSAGLRLAGGSPIGVVTVPPAVAAGPCAVGAAVFLSGPAGGPGRCRGGRCGSGTSPPRPG
jgi:hypothetical protein